ncbi:heavy-metal-associated domain-containing protein [Sphingomonas sp.]|uniref:heavy-metal-associated domain-containing protein n=1 Tax=Sphingomonas sp. TaxID=28214 RepID=UPI0035C7A295
MRSRPFLATAAAIGVAVLGAGAVVAQIEGGDRGVAAVDSSNDYEVGSVSVDTSGPNAQAARVAGWREAQRKAWVQLSRRLGGGGAMVPDGTLDSLVSAIVVGNEQIGPTRYIAQLGVLFDRARTAGLLGISSYVSRTPPLVVVPVVWSGGVGGVFEQRTAWQEAWARFRTSTSEIDYIRPPGNGADPLLLNVGQTQRPARGWWRKVLDLYGGTDVLIPVVRLRRQWPGGPVIGEFEARHGPDNRLLSRFALRAANASALPQLLDAGVKRMDDIYQAAARGGYLRGDPGLSPPPTEAVSDIPAVTETLAPTDDASAPVVSIIVQVETPDAGAVASTESALRGVPGVRSASTSSLALGGVSLMVLSFAGEPANFRAGLEARGWQVFGGGTTMRIRRAPQLLPPDLQPDNALAG